MKRKTLLVSLLSVILILGLIFLTGCVKKDEEKNQGSNQGTSQQTESNKEITINNANIKLSNERNLKNLTFKYPDEAKFINEEENHLSFKVYEDGNEEKEIINTVITVRPGKNCEEYIKYMREVDASELQTQTYNGKKWYIYNYNSEKSVSKMFYCQDGEDTYVLSFPQEGDARNIDISSYIAAFMNNTRF